MPTRDKLSEQKKIKSRLEILKTWMSSFVMATAAIVAVIVFVPSSPKASLVSITVFQNEVIYQVEITDQDEALDLNTLNIILSNQFGEVSKPLNLGMNVGIFEGLYPNTQYILTVYGSKGFGNEKLDEQVIKTKENSGGAIISTSLVESFEWNHHYHIEVLVRDENDLYTDVNLYYAYIYDQETNPTYSNILITEEREGIDLLDVPVYNSIVHLYLEAELNSGGLVILDELYFAVPFRLESSIFLEHIDQNLIEYSLYPDYSSNQNVIYTFDLYFGKQKIDSQVIEYSKDEQITHTENNYITFDGLKKSTLYQIIVSASYQNPVTLKNDTVILREEEIKTLGDYEIEFELIQDLNLYEVYVYLNDPNHYFQNVSYVIYDTTGEFPSYIEGMSYGFIPDLDGKYQQFSFNAPSVSSYQIIIRVISDSEYLIYHTVYDQNIKP